MNPLPLGRGEVNLPKIKLIKTLTYCTRDVRSFQLSLRDSSGLRQLAQHLSPAKDSTDLKESLGLASREGHLGN